MRVFPLIAASTIAAALMPGAATAENLVAVDVADSPAKTGPRVTATCKIESPVLQQSGIQFVISGNAVATNSDVTPLPIATHVHCDLVTDSGDWGGPAGDAPGAVAVAAGTSLVVPFDRLGGLRVCAYGSAFFQGGVTVSSSPSRGC